MNDNPMPCPGHSDLAPRAGDPVWCGPCARYLRGELDSLPYLAARLLLEMENATAAGAEHVSGSKERPIHARERYAFCIDDIAGFLTYWAEAVREDRGLAPSPAGRPRGVAITADTRLLLIHFDWMICQHPEPAQSTEFGNDIRKLHRRATRLTHTHDVRPERCDGVACPKCDLLMLEHELDWQGRATGYIACAGCGDLMTMAEYERWLKMLAAPLKRTAA